MDFFHKFIHGLGEFYTFCGRYPLYTGTAIFHTDEVQHGKKKCHTSSRVIVSGCVMAVSRVTAAHDHAVSTFFKGTEDKHWIYTAGAWYADDLYISRIRKTAASCKVCTCVAAPVTAECHDLRSEFFFCFYRYIASTSAKICLLENPWRSIAPDGQVTVHAPQPWQRALFTTAILLVSRIPWSFTCFSS